MQCELSGGWPSSINWPLCRVDNCVAPPGPNMPYMSGFTKGHTYTQYLTIFLAFTQGGAMRQKKFPDSQDKSQGSKGESDFVAFSLEKGGEKEREESESHFSLSLLALCYETLSWS